MLDSAHRFASPQAAKLRQPAGADGGRASTSSVNQLLALSLQVGVQVIGVLLSAVVSED